MSPVIILHFTYKKTIQNFMNCTYIMVIKRIKRGINVELRMRLLFPCFLLVKGEKVLHRLHKFCSSIDISEATIKKEREKNKQKKKRKSIRPKQL